jgi:hypothetical protein
MNTPLVAGRFFTNDDDTGNTHFVIVNQSFAAKYFVNRNPIGGQVGYSGHSQRNTVIGVVGDVRHSSLEANPEPQIYFPFEQGEEWGAFIVAHSVLPPQAVVSAIRATVKTIDPDLAVADIHTMGDLVSEAGAGLPSIPCRSCGPSKGASCNCADKSCPPLLLRALVVRPSHAAVRPLRVFRC